MAAKTNCPVSEKSSVLLVLLLCCFSLFEFPTAVRAEYATQTVYGFLDFTTTIGNTVMVFSPQSAAPSDDGKDKTTESAINAVIETKPVTSASSHQPQQPPPTIKPSKTITDEGEKRPPSSSSSLKEASGEVSTVVNVQSKKPSSNVPVSSAPSSVLTHSSSKVNVQHGPSSVVNVVPVVSSKVQVVTGSSVILKPTQVSKTSIVVSSTIQSVHQNSPVLATSVVVSSSSSEESEEPEEPAIIVGNNIVSEPEYDFLSRQPSEFVEETYKVVNLKQNTKHHAKPHQSSNTKSNKGPHHSTPRPTGLVTKLGGTVVKDGATTVHETSVIGTYISGKYAQVLQSTSHVSHPKVHGKIILPSASLRILKTNAPNLSKHTKHSHEVSSSSSEEFSSAETSNHPQNGAPKNSKKHSSGSKRPKGKSHAHQETTSGPTGPPQGGFKKIKQGQSTTRLGFGKQHTTQAPPPPPPPSPSHRSHKSSHKHGKKSSRSSVSVHSEPPPTQQPSSSQPSGRKYQNRKHKINKPQPPPSPTSSEEVSTVSSFQRKTYKSRPGNHQNHQQHSIQPSTPQQQQQQGNSDTSIYKFKLNRTPGRWQYKTSPKPRVNIRKQPQSEEEATTLISTDTSSSGGAAVYHHSNEVVTQGSSLSGSNPLSRSDEAEGLDGSESIASITGDESSTDNKIDNPFPLETIKVEISTPPDFKDTYYEIATIKSPYTFQVGSVKNTRYITVTSTFEKLLDDPTATDNAILPTKTTEPLTENILATSNNYDKDHNFLDSSIATLPPLYMASDVATPPLETMTETFSTTQTMLKTHILPAVRYQNETSSYTLIQTYLVTRLVTATKTLPPMEAYHFVPSKILNEFNSHLDEAGSELNLELAFGDENDNDPDVRPPKKAFPPDLDLAQIGSDFDLSEVDKSNLPMEMHLRSKKAHGPVTTPKPQPAEPTANLSPEQLQQLALLRLFNPGAAALGQGQVITTSKPVVKVDTLYESHVIPIIHGHSTHFTTISKSKGLVTKTDYEFGTSTVQPQLPNLPIAPLFPPPQQQQFAITSSPIVQTTQVIQTNSKILKLTFGARTAYTTILSTQLVPTVLTTYLTQSVAVQPTAAFPGFFPAPYAPFPYVG